MVLTSGFISSQFSDHSFSQVSKSQALHFGISDLADRTYPLLSACLSLQNIYSEKAAHHNEQDCSNMPSPENDNGLPAFMSRGNKNGQASTCCPLIQIQGDQERRNIVKKNRQLHSICVRPAQPDRIYPEYQVHGPIQR